MRGNNMTSESDIRVDELWVVVDGFPNYHVSNYGRVVNKRGMELRPRVDASGFCNVALYDQGYRRDFGVHRLVAKAFFVDYHDDVEVFHLNDNREDNAVLNLSLGNKVRIQVRISDTDKIFGSMWECARFLNGTASGVQAAIQAKRPYHGVRLEVVDIYAKA
jgi:hypothetical protein